MTAIKISKPILKIQVNDNGDTITINLSDQIFIRNFLELAEYGSKNKLEVKDLSNIEDLNKVLDYSKGMSQLIDKAFGIGSTVKIFETTEPTPDLIADFVLQLEPYIEQAYDLKKEAVNKQKKAFSDRAKSRENSR